MKNLITIVIMLVVTGCLRKVETDDQDVKEEKRPSGNELPPEPPPPPQPVADGSAVPSTNK